MSEMLDRVATAIAFKQGIVFRLLSDDFKAVFRDKARYVVGAMREPTKDMVREPYGWGMGLEAPDVTYVWQSMIDEVLK